MHIIDQTNANGVIVDHWTLGGGTALMLQIGHRESHDIDLFIPDPQWLPYLNPLTQDYNLELTPSDYETDGTRVLKLTFDAVGEIDFICCSPLTDTHSELVRVCGREIMLELPSEIVAKKVFYRGATLQPRDMFDIAAVIEHFGEDALLSALQPFKDRCAVAADAAEAMRPDFALQVMKTLIVRERFEHVTDIAQRVTVDFLRKVGR